MSIDPPRTKEELINSIAKVDQEMREIVRFFEENPGVGDQEKADRFVQLRRAKHYMLIEWIHMKTAMNWYGLAKKFGMALDPEAYAYEANPARLRRDLDYQTLPFGMGKIHQPQDPKEIKNKYLGVHFTPSKETAGIYACGKATKNDPPVIIAVNPKMMQKVPDVDASLNVTTITDYLGDIRQHIQNILSQTKNPSDAKDLILEKLDRDSDHWEYNNEDTDAASIIAEEGAGIPPRALEHFLSPLPARKAVAQIKAMLKGNIPDELLIAVTNQFRILQSIGHREVEGIYQIPWVAFEEDPLDWDAPDELLEERGYHKEGDDLVNEEGKIIISYDDALYGHWLSMTPLYKNQQMPFEWFEEDVVWHGTSLSRAKQAFPELLP